VLPAFVGVRMNVPQGLKPAFQGKSISQLLKALRHPKATLTARLKSCPDKNPTAPGAAEGAPFQGIQPGWGRHQSRER